VTRVFFSLILPLSVLLYDDSDLCASISGAARPLGRQISSGTQLTFIRRDEGGKEIIRKQLYDSVTTIDDRARRRPLYYAVRYEKLGPRSLSARHRSRQNQYYTSISHKLYTYISHTMTPCTFDNETNELN